MKIQTFKIDDINPYDQNVKNHDDAQVAKIAQSIRTFGWDQPIVVDADNVIIKGHGRRLAAIKLGLKEVPVLVRADLTPDQVKAARLADNHVAMGTFDTEMLRNELASFSVGALESLTDIFTVNEIEYSLSDLGLMDESAFIPDVDAAVKEQEAAAHTKAGEVADRRVPLTKIMGIKDIKGSNEIYLTRFLVFIESKTGLKGEDALIGYVRSQIGE